MYQLAQKMSQYFCCDTELMLAYLYDRAKRNAFLTALKRIAEECKFDSEASQAAMLYRELKEV